MAHNQYGLAMSQNGEYVMCRTSQDKYGVKIGKEVYYKK